jgi:hypothetical protein
MDEETKQTKQQIMDAVRAACASRETISDSQRLKELERVVEREHRARIVHKTTENARVEPRRHDPEPEPQPEQVNLPWWEWVTQRCEYLIEQRLKMEREVLMETVGEFVSEYVSDLVSKSPGLKADDIRALRIDIADLKAGISDFREAAAASRDAPRPARSVQ